MQTYDNEYSLSSSRIRGADFLERLVKEAAIEAKKGGERGLTPQSVRKATPVSLHDARALRRDHGD